MNGGHGHFFPDHVTFKAVLVSNLHYYHYYSSQVVHVGPFLGCSGPLQCTTFTLSPPYLLPTHSRP